MAEHDSTVEAPLNAHGLTRRAFIGAGVLGGASLLTGGFDARLLGASTVSASGDAIFLEQSIPQLQLLMASGELTSRELTRGYLERIRDLDPRLGSVIETNSIALLIAARMDVERRNGQVRGPLHGIPILLKDNIGTDDNMGTTAGSFALLGSRVPRDAVVAARLRAAGAILLGKTNLSEWANFRGFAPFNGWSARGGFTRNPYLLSADPSGSSSGSAVAVATNFCAAAVGTETDGSIVAPAGNNLIVGLKPTLGLISQDGIIPIAHSQDTAGPMGRTVTDVAILLDSMVEKFVPGQNLVRGNRYTQFLRRGSLRGKRIGVDMRYFTPDYGGEPDVVEVAMQALDAMEGEGAILVETDSGDPNAYYDDEFTALLFEFKVQIAEYLSELERTSMRTLADLIAFNNAHCPAEMRFFGQELFELAESTSGNLSDPDYVSARTSSVQLARAGISGAMTRDRLNAIVSPSDTYASSAPAVAGYPSIALPVGLTTTGRPAGIWMYGRAYSESTLLAIGYDLEQVLQPRLQPTFAGDVPPRPENPGICAAVPRARAFSGRARMPYHIGTGKPFKR